MEKYEVRFCSCGRVHFFDNEKVLPVLESGKQFVFVCKHCGAMTSIWFDDMFDGKCYCSNTVNEGEVKLEDIGMLFYSRGEMIPMTNGEEASYHGDVFISHKDGEICRTVDTKALINSLRREPDKLICLSHFLTSIDWKGTEYERKF